MQGFFIPIPFTVVIALTLLSGASPMPSRLIFAKVELDGTVILTGRYGDDGFQRDQIVWGYLGKIRFSPTEDFRQQLRRGDPDSAVQTVAGEIVVSISHGGRVSTDLIRLKKAEGQEDRLQLQITETSIKSLHQQRWGCKTKTPSASLDCNEFGRRVNCRPECTRARP